MNPATFIPVTVIGSWSFPGWYEKFIREVAEHPDEYGPFDREESVRDAVRLAVNDQLKAGLDRITDGEMQRVNFNLGFYAFLQGINLLTRARLLGAPAPISVTSTSALLLSRLPAAWGSLRSTSDFGAFATHRRRCLSQVHSRSRAVCRVVKFTAIARR